LKRFAEQYKRLLIQLLTAVLLILCLSAEAAFARPKQIVFVVKSKNIPSYNRAIEGFKHKASCEWTIVEYDLAGRLESAGKMLKKLKEEKPDLVVAVGTRALTALVNSKVPQPTIFCMVMNPAAYDLSSCDIAGVSLAVSNEEKIRVLTELSPKIKRIAVFLRKQSSPELLKDTAELAAGYRVKIIPVEIGSEKEIPRKLRAVLGRVDALCMLDDSFIRSKETLEFVVLKSLENNLPFMSISKVFVKEGSLLALSPSFFGNGQQAAQMAEKVLVEGVRAKNIPISLYKEPELFINLKIARKINLDVPPALLDRAKQVYE